jgi:TrmH family RNA methyltransferase
MATLPPVFPSPADPAPSPSPASAPAVVLVRPREEGNVGSAARAMANMGLSRLILVEPAAILGSTATAFAVGARHVLEGSERAPSLAAALAPFRRVIGTTSARDRRLGVPLLAPRELPAFLAQDLPGTPTALVFGPEVGGLTNDELAFASAVVTVPCAPVQPTLNLAQAVLILAYELYVGGGQPGAAAADASVEPAASSEALDGMLAHAAEALAAVGFARDDSWAGVLRDLRALAARAVPTEREVRVLRGICRRVLGAVKKG